jgi:hypothetical protein
MTLKLVGVKRDLIVDWPQSVMTGAAAKYAKAMATALEPSENFLFMAYLTVLGHVAANRIRLESELNIAPRLYTVLLGESADARKSTAITKTLDFFIDTLPLGTLNTVLGAGSAEGLARAFSSNNSVLMVIDELKALIQKMKIESSVLLPFVCTLFDSARFQSLTKTHSIKIENGALALLAASTLDSYQHMFTQQFTDIGLLNRLFVVIGNSDRKFPVPIQLPAEVYAELQMELRRVISLVDRLNRIGGTPYVMPITPMARKIFADWYFSQENSIFDKRIDTFGHRLMLLIALNDESDMVTESAARKTVALLRYQVRARRQADPIDADSKIAKLEENIRRVLEGNPLSKERLAQRCNKRRVGIWIWNQSLSNLIKSGEVEYDSVERVYKLLKE